MKTKTAVSKPTSPTVKSTPPRTAKKTAKGPSSVKAAKTPITRPSSVASRNNSKQANLIAALGTANGTTIKKMMAVTGWQAHIIRGAISGVLRKKLGLNVTCESSAKSGEPVYRIVGSAVSA
jgi:hypothetical protein